MVQSSIQALKSRLLGGVGRFVRSGVVMSFISLMMQIRAGLGGDSPRSIVEEIISWNYESDDASPFAAWPWADFGKVMSKELIAQDAALYPAKGAELKQS